MGRTKNTPSKRGNTLFSALSTIGEFVPLHRPKKYIKKKSRTTVPSYKVILVQEQHEQYYLGDVRVGSTSNVFPENVNSCTTSFTSNEDRDAILLNLNGDCDLVVQALENIDFLKDFIQTKMFSFKIYTQDENCVYFKVYLTVIPLPKFYPKLAKCIQTAFSLFYNVNAPDAIEKSKTQESLSCSELKEVYEKLLDMRDDSEYSHVKKTPIPFLKPVLRPYQEKSLQWMIYRETKSNDFNSTIHPLYQNIQLKSGLEIYYDKYTTWIEKNIPLVQSQWKGGILADEMGLGKTVEVLALILSHRYDENCDSTVPNENEELVIMNQSKKRKLNINDQTYVEPKKIKTHAKKSSTFQALQTIYNRTLSEYCTTEVRSKPKIIQVQCICGNNIEKDCVQCEDCDKLQHSQCLGYKEEFGPYKCPQCWAKADLINSKATLIVTPAALRRQWCKEMKTHLKSGLNVLNYQGNNATPVYPTEFQNYDIIITTYNVLQAEMRLTETSQELNMRNARKYWPGGSPLVRVKWWRLCLDEAQTVESPTSIISAMAGKIIACHRWAVTGTPISKGVSDIYGLIDYLKMEPYNDPATWRHILYDNYVRGDTKPMFEFLSKVLWRTTKDSVLDQINIPQQTQELHLVELSAVEKFSYKQQHNRCAKDFLAISRKYPADLALEKMNKSDLRNLMAPLFSLRQACSDPSTARGNDRDLPLNKNTSSMKELLEAIILRNKNDCEEKLRLMISAINGASGIQLLMDDPDQAIRGYRRVLQLAAEFSSNEKNNQLTVDKLPLIHAMHNLAELLDMYQSNDHTLRDSTLRQDCIELEKQYIEKFMIASAAGKEACQTISDNIEELKDDFNLDFGQWYSDGFDWIALSNFENDLISRIDSQAIASAIDCDLRNDNCLTLRRTVYNWHATIFELRDKLFKLIDSMYEQDEETKQLLIVDGLVESAMDCHLRPQLVKGKKIKTKKCKVCLANRSLQNYEENLFTVKNRGDNIDEMSLIRFSKLRIEELILKALLGLMKSRDANPELIKDGETQMQLFDVLKKEFKEIRKVWTLLDQQVCAQDELDICKVRFQLKTAEDSKTKANRDLQNLTNETHKDNLNLIPFRQLPYQELGLKTDEQRYNAELQVLLGTRNYLNTLNQQQFEGCATDPCPICRCSLEDTWVILLCAHTYCLKCFETLVNKNMCPPYHIYCCVCRLKQSIQEVGYIKGTNVKDENNKEPQTKVLGDFSKKIQAAIQLVLNLKNKDPYVKVLLFSTWTPVLRLLKRALTMNDIKSGIAEATSTSEKTIEAFKDPVEKITVLLLPIKLGSRGLNLIEATHVILLEPLLNPADELQAVGRVHRIGQTKPTVVHKFLVKDTVEEALHNATSSNASEWEKGKINVGLLKGLFENNNVELVG
ncbi:unnamed protein product [Ceutorhynchus assimilis]|uniref:E3 ubiquitin-protein ligase SHPRH n=1 Tax=Ceutorhynchus assimilis TaxID=467358 RepID=A0A9P0DJF6_9CUCU|nr:unnamed protein product [Ceutorhynchus assimilis]